MMVTAQTYEHKKNLGGHHDLMGHGRRSYIAPRHDQLPLIVFGRVSIKVSIPSQIRFHKDYMIRPWIFGRGLIAPRVTLRLASAGWNVLKS